MFPHIHTGIFGSREAEIIAPSPIVAVPQTDTKTIIQWSAVGEAITYELQRDTDPAFGTPTALQNTSATFYEDSGLTADTQYYYRVRTKGTIDSDWIDTNCTTYKTPLLWFEATGIRQNTNNDFAETSNGYDVDVLKPFFGSSSIGLSPNSTTRSVNRDNIVTPVIKWVSDQQYNFSSNLTLSGDFHIIVNGMIGLAPLPSIGRLLDEDGVATNRSEFRFNSSDTNKFDSITNLLFDTNPNAPITLSSANHMNAGEYVQIELKRVSGLFSFRKRGESWDTSGANTNTNDMVFSHWLGTVFDQLERFVIFNEELSDAEANNVHDYMSLPDYTLPSQPTSFTGLDADTSVASKIVSIANLDNKATASFIRDRMIQVGNEVIINVNLDDGQDWDDILLKYDVSNSQISATKSLGVTEPIEARQDHDYHNSGSIGIRGDKLFHIEAASHYGAGLAGSHEMVIKESAKGFDLSTFKTKKLARNIAAIVGENLQYVQTKTIGNDTYVLCQEFKYKTVLYKFSDDMEYPERILLFDGDDNNANWMYHHLVDSNDGRIRIFLNHYDQTGTQDIDVGYVYSDDGYTWYDRTGVNSKEVFESQSPFTISEIQADYLIFDVSAYTGGVQVTDAIFDGTTVHAVCHGEDDDGTTPGENTYNTYFTINDSTGALNKYEIDTGATAVETGTDSESWPLLWLDADGHVHVACFETNSGNWIWAEYESTDGGTSWSRVGAISNDNTFKFQRPAKVRNMSTLSVSKSAIACIREDKADTTADTFNGNGDLLIHEIDI